MLGPAAELTRGRRLARNVGHNVVGWAVPAVAALAAIPALVRSMGPDRFGLLALAWTFVGPFSPIDLGVGRALTQALAERAGRADEGDSPDVAWSGWWLLLGVGVTGGLALAAAAPAMVRGWLHVPGALADEAARAIALLALAVPLTALTSGLRGVLEAGQEFRTVNALRVPLALASFVGPWLVQPWSRGLPAAVSVLVLARGVVMVLHAGAVARRYPTLRRVRAPHARALRELWRVAGWITVSTLATPLLGAGDRFVIGGALPIAALARYAAVSEVALKLTVVGAVLQPVLFPALAATRAADPARATAVFDRAVRVAAFGVAPPALLLVALAPEGLRLWLRAGLAADAAPVLQLLAIAAYLNTLAQMPYVALQSAGRADAAAKLHAAEVPLYLAGLWLLVGRFGLVGAAVAWTLRSLGDAVALYVAAGSVLHQSRAVMRRSLLLVVGGAAALGACAAVPSLAARMAVAVLVGVAFAAGGARWLVTPEERAVARGAIGRGLRRRRPAVPAASPALHPDAPI